MRVHVDFDLCDSMGLCMAAAPEVFDVGDDGLMVVVQDEPSEDQRPFVVEAARRCPKRAITLDG